MMAPFAKLQTVAGTPENSARTHALFIFDLSNCWPLNPLP
jgi:hypothetical protein